MEPTPAQAAEGGFSSRVAPGRLLALIGGVLSAVEQSDAVRILGFSSLGDLELRPEEGVEYSVVGRLQEHDDEDPDQDTERQASRQTKARPGASVPKPCGCRRHE